MDPYSHSMAIVSMRTAAGERIGLGHAGRLAALAERLLEQGATVEVQCTGDDRGLLTAMDGIATNSATTPDWIVSDLPTPLDEGRASAWAQSSRLCLVDDRGPAREHADLVVGPPTAAWTPGPERHLWTGPGAVLVRSEFAEAQPKPMREGPIVVALGGTGGRLVGSVARELWTATNRDLRILSLEPLEPTLERWRASGNVASAHVGAALVVGAFGHSVLEAAVMRVPAVFGYWSSQTPADAHAFAKRGTAAVVGVLTPASIPALVDTAVGLLDNQRRWEFARAACEAFPSDGAQRLANLLLEGPW